MRKVQCLEQLVHVESDVIVGNLSIESLQRGVIDKLKDESGCFGLWIADNIEKANDVSSPVEVTQDFDLTPIVGLKQKRKIKRNILNNQRMGGFKKKVVR